MEKLLNRWNSLNPPVRWMIYFFSFWIFMSILLSPKAPEKDLMALNFKYTQSGKMYFHNIRSFYYTRDNYRGFQRYQLKKLEKTDVPLNFVLLENLASEELFIAPMIDSNWLHSEVFIASDTVFELLNSNRDYMHTLAAHIFLALENGEDVRLRNRAGETWSMQEDVYIRKGIETVLFDYFRWKQLR
jgi:hypothetical protein